LLPTIYKHLPFASTTRQIVSTDRNALLLVSHTKYNAFCETISEVLNLKDKVFLKLEGIIMLAVTIPSLHTSEFCLSLMVFMTTTGNTEEYLING
jgi:hypothetical protein